MHLIKKFESTIWISVKAIFVLSMLIIFMLFLAKENPPLIRLSRTMGITITTFIVVEFLFTRIYGTFDVGRRKSKPIIYSLSLATFFTDVFVYLQLMIMNTIEPTVRAFEFNSVGALVLAYIIQLIVIVGLTYGSNALFFQLHEPESSLIITSSQESLDIIAKAISKYKKGLILAGQI